MSTTDKTTIEKVRDLVDSANESIEAEDWGKAHNRLLRAKALMATLQSGAKGSESVDYDRRAIDELLNMVQRESSASVGIQTVKIETDGVGTD